MGKTIAMDFNTICKVHTINRLSIFFKNIVNNIDSERELLDRSDSIDRNYTIDRNATIDTCLFYVVSRCWEHVKIGTLHIF